MVIPFLVGWTLWVIVQRTLSSLVSGLRRLSIYIRVRSRISRNLTLSTLLSPTPTHLRAAAALSRRFFTLFISTSFPSLDLFLICIYIGRVV